MHPICDVLCKSLQTDCKAQVATQSLMTIPRNAVLGPYWNIRLDKMHCEYTTVALYVANSSYKSISIKFHSVHAT